MGSGQEDRRRRHRRHRPAHGQIASSSPPIVVGDVIVVGNSSIHGYYPIRVRNLPGYVRGFDIRTGKQLWKFNLVPQPGEFGAETWKNGSKVGTEGVGKNDAWATYSADPELGLVYIPVGMPLMDEYGGHRPGDNLYGNSLVALDAKTGQRKWHYQMVHHDIWDYDTPMAPNLMDVTVDGRLRKVIAQTTKQGWVYTFDRVTGEPIWPMPKRRCCRVTCRARRPRRRSRFRPSPRRTSQQGLVEDGPHRLHAGDQGFGAQAREAVPHGTVLHPRRPRAMADPTGFTLLVVCAGRGGGVNIDGGAAVDPETGMMYVGSQSGLSTIVLQKDPCSEFRYSSPRDSCGLLGAIAPPPGYTPPTERPGGFAGRAGASSIGGVSIVKPKQLGGITAYDMNTGDKAWWMPNGGFIQTTSRTRCSPASRCRHARARVRRRSSRPSRW